MRLSALSFVCFILNLVSQNSHIHAAWKDGLGLKWLSHFMLHGMMYMGWNVSHFHIA
jgi:hypothetical protein